ncbi:MAG TPA: efflux RND transporter periplasmic adaptor subunit [Thermoanaerobaculaceae bacterium]|nr:efflux RND transporter periplasmic adaptor subunit [Thermoanaerobaculaceae bacterium]
MGAEQGAKGPDLAGLRIAEGSRTSGSGGRKARWIVLAVVLLLLVVGLGWVLRGRTPEVEVASARPASGAPGATLLNASGYVTPRQRATVAAKITARVVDVLVDEGMAVKQGDVLARLDDSDAQRRLLAARTARDATAAAVANLEVNLANAERELERQRNLEKEGVSSVETLDTARTTAESLRAQIVAAQEQIKAADAQIAVAQQDVDNCTVTAPFSGMVVSKDAQVGEMVSPLSAGGGFTRTGIATIVDMNSLEIEVDVNESYIARVKPDQRVDAVLDAYPDWHIPSKVRTVIPTADRQKATVKVRISFDKLDPRILPDMGVKVAFLAAEPGGAAAAAPRALVPQAAVREIDGKKVVFVLHDGRVERRAVSVGGVRDSDVEVLAGLNEGDQVVVSGPPDLHDGEAVRVKR